jgi:hypothetical protein
MPGPSQTARIFVPPRSAMQSGKGRTQDWVLEFAPGERQNLDPLMGWAGSGDTRGQVRLRFPTREEAAKVYADNFRYGRTENWTH